MKIWVSQNKLDMARAAANDGASHIRDAIAASGHAAIILATGASEFEMLDALVAQADVEGISNGGYFKRVMDEYHLSTVTYPVLFITYPTPQPHRQVPSTTPRIAHSPSHREYPIYLCASVPPWLFPYWLRLCRAVASSCVQQLKRVQNTDYLVERVGMLGADPMGEVL